MRFALLALLATPAAVSAQDILYYKFETGGGSSIINYARSQRADREGRLRVRPLTDPNKSWTKGKMGIGGYNAFNDLQIDTGFDGFFSGDLTVAFFLRVTKPFGPNEVALFGPGDVGTPAPPHAVFHDDKGKLRVSVPGFNFQINKRRLDTLAFQRWVHVAIVFDAKAGTMTSYIDAQRELVLQFKPGPPIKAPWNFRVGPRRGKSWYELDEFRLSLRPAKLDEIKRWATADLAGDGVFGKPCHPKGRSVLLDSNQASAGLPKVGNKAYGYELFGLPGSVYAISLGSSRLKLGPIPLPFDLGVVNPALKGCLWHSSMDLALVPGVLDNAGKATVPISIPNDARLVGHLLYNQALLFHAFIPTLMMTNAFATAIGR